jgi:predicted enzyme related to lactoylglutathione lyase
MKASLCVMLFAGALVVAPSDALNLSRTGSTLATMTAQESPLVPHEQIVFLYYKDLEAVDAFFGRILGFKKTMDLDWVKIFQTVAGSSIGCVKEGRGSLKTSVDKPVMVSWVVDDVEAWQRRLTASGVKIAKPVHVSAEPPMKSLLFEDSAGYTFELVEWLKR